jgi:hypothetical protein
MGTLMSEAEADRPEDSEAATAQPLVCDFCGQQVAQVRRIALDRDYDRLQKPHAVQYACAACSAAKERQRLGNDAG